jgi:branched-chain amino acid transport system ATP-binding protein
MAETTSTAEPLLSVRGLCVRYGGIQAVRELDLDVPSGQTLVLVGANGAGKSSVINTIMGLVSAAGGQVRFRGEDISGLRAQARAVRGMRISPEGRRVFAAMSVEDNVLAGCYGVPAKRRAATLDWLYQTFPLLAQRRRQPAGTLSGGQQQIVALARAMSSAPALLLLDEPFLGLAPVMIRDTSAAIRAIQERGTTIVLSEQMAVPALKLADAGCVIRGGQVRRRGSVADIQQSALAEDYL